MIKPYYEQDGITIYNCDCRDILPELPKVDLVLTDPPYGIGLEYETYIDSSANLKELINSTIPLLISKTDRMALTCGVLNMYSYPKPDWVMAWISSAGVGCSKWGFCCWQPILVYGNDPYLKSGSGRLPDIFTSNETTQIKDHPCSKPIGLWSKVLKRCSQQETDIILDPFMGSGTTLVAAKKLGRKAIGIEIEQKYCDIAIKRLQQTVMSFEIPKEKIEQNALF